MPNQRTAITFERWMILVDAEVSSIAGCSVHDLPDCTFRDWYDDGVSPRTAAKRAIRTGKDE